MGFVTFNFYRIQEEPRSQKVGPYQFNYEATGVKKKERYSFWVTASTNVGEGEASKTVTIAPGSQGRFS